MRRLRVLFVQPSLAPPGGGNGVASWMLQALASVHDVTLLTWGPVDFEELNRFWGTSLSPAACRIVRVPAAIRRFLESMPVPLGLVRTAVMQRMARRMRARFDVPITCNNEADFGTLGVQYLHYPWHAPRPAADIRWYHGGSALRWYYAFCWRVGGFELAAAQRNITLVNSDWTGRLIRAQGFVPRTLYPPVVAGPPGAPWEARVPGFVCIGRIVPEKQLDRVIDIVAGVRTQVPGVTLHIVGTRDDGPYHDRIAARARAAGFALHQGISRRDLDALIAANRYGIHGMLEEHFGMAPAELVRAGCLVWVPNGGGQVEIVTDPRLIYGSVEEAIGKIVAVLRDPHEQATLRKHLAVRGERLSPERFMREVLEAVDDAAAGRAP
jgi:glycosyltransferase involved in cell wall biosynthesis